MEQFVGKWVLIADSVTGFEEYAEAASEYSPNVSMVALFRSVKTELYGQSYLTGRDVLEYFPSVSLLFVCFFVFCCCFFVFVFLFLGCFFCLGGEGFPMSVYVCLCARPCACSEFYLISSKQDVFANLLRMRHGLNCI